MIAEDAEARAAWECLVGPADWDKARTMEPQPDEPPEKRETSYIPIVPNMRKADMVVVAASGLLPDLAGGPDLLAEVIAEVEAESAESKTNDATGDASA